MWSILSHPNVDYITVKLSRRIYLWRHNLVNKQLQYTYCPISHEVKTTSQWNLFSKRNIIWEIFFFKNHAGNEAGRLVPDFFFVFLKSFIWGKGKWSAA